MFFGGNKPKFWFILTGRFTFDRRYTWSLYIPHTGFTGSANSSTDGSLVKGFSGYDKVFAILQKYILNDFAISSSLHKVTPLSIKSIEKRGFTGCQKFLLVAILLIFIITKYSEAAVQRCSRNMQQIYRRTPM